MKKNVSLTFLSLGILFLAACGSSDGTNPNTVTSQPVLMAPLPPSAPLNATVTIQGVGFSFAPNENIVLVGNTTTVGVSYQIIPSNQLPANGAIEEITFAVPNSAQIGAGNITVIVGGVPSNAIPFTVESP